MGTADRCQRAQLAEWIENRTTTHGPWKQDVAVARSEDGLTWTTVLGDDGAPLVVVPTAAVPEAVVAPDGRTWLFTVDGRLDRLQAAASDPSAGLASRGLPGLGALAAAVSTDGLHFEPVPEVEISGLGAAMFADPDIVAAPGGGWRMYYLAMSAREYAVDAKWTEGERHEIHSAVSSDLVHWRSEGPVVRGPYADPTFTCFPAVGCMLFSFGLDLSRSKDGVHFAYEGRWNGIEGFAPDAFTLGPGQLRIYYNDATLGAPLRAVVTRDVGLSWAAEPGVSLDRYGEAPSVLRRSDGTWWMYYHTFKPGMRLPNVPDPGQAPTAAPTPRAGEPGEAPPPPR